MNSDAKFVLLAIFIVIVLAVVTVIRNKQTVIRNKDVYDRKARYICVRKSQPRLEIAELQVYDINNINIGLIAEYILILTPLKISSVDILCFFAITYASSLFLK